jgi:hypothetical protein
VRQPPSSVESWDRHVRIAGIANCLLGALLFAWPLVLAFPHGDGAPQRIFGVLGALAVICGGARALLPRRHLMLSIANSAFGFWILLSPAAFGFDMTRQMAVACVAAGGALMAFAWWSISETIKGEDPWG